MGLCRKRRFYTWLPWQDSFASGSLRILRILRLARSARGLRVVRLLRFIRPLRLLVFSIAVTLKSLIWSVILLFIIIYLFSILFADANLAHFTSEGNIPPAILTDSDLQSHFGSVQISMHTLFRAICGGLEWRHAANSLDRSIGWGSLTLECVFFIFPFFSDLPSWDICFSSILILSQVLFVCSGVDSFTSKPPNPTYDGPHSNLTESIIGLIDILGSVCSLAGWSQLFTCYMASRQSLKRAQLFPVFLNMYYYWLLLVVIVEYCWW